MKLSKLFTSGEGRTSTIIKNVFWGTGIKGISIIISLILVPMTINFVSSELYGIWLTLSSIIGWLGFFDIGFGLGLRNKLTTAIAQNDFNLGKRYVSTTYFLLTIIFGCIAITGYFLAESINWCRLLNVNEQYHDLLISTSRVVIITFCLNFILKLLQNVYQAYQMTAVASGLDTLGQFVSLVGIWVLTKTTAPDLNNLAIIFCFTPCVLYLVASIFSFTGRFKAVAPSIKSVKATYARDVFNIGSQFF